MKKVRKIVALMLCFVLLLSGCRSVNDENENKKVVYNLESIQNEMAGMYVEESMNIPQGIGEPVSVVTGEGNSLRMLGIDHSQESEGMELFEFTDSNWVDRTPEWFSEWKKGKYIISYAQSTDNCLIFGYGVDGTRGYLYVDEEGTQRELRLTVNGRELAEDCFIKTFTFSENNRLFAMDTSSVVYEVDAENGEMKEILEVVSADFIKCSNNLLVVFGGNRVYLYDLNSETILEQDNVLEEFVNSKKSLRSSGGDRNIADMIVTSMEDNILYVLSRGGIYRHVIGGTAMELIVDGARNSLSEPDVMFADFICKEDGSFIVLTSDGRLLRYAYDKNAIHQEVTQENIVKIFSIRENHYIRTAISLYQKENPDKQIIYEVGMTADNGITREDAVKNLNTSIMAGDGPNIIVMDDLNADNFIEKGILQDISSVVDEMEQVNQILLLENIVEGYRTDGKIYMLPCQFSVQIMAGKEEELADVTDLLTLAQKAEELRNEKTDGEIFGMVVPETLLETLIPICIGAWQNDDGTINESALEEFFNCSKRIYDASIGKMTEEKAKRIEEIRNFINEYPDQFIASISNSSLTLMTKESKMIFGPLTSVKSQLPDVTSAMKQGAGGTFDVLNGQQNDVFIPKTIIAVSSQKEMTQTVKEFVKFLFSNEVQQAEVDYGEGLAVNQQIFENMFVREKPEGEMEYSVVTSSEDGEMLYLEIYFPTDEELVKAKKMMLNLKTPLLSNNNLKEAVTEAALKLLNGEQDESGAVAEVKEKMELYLAE